MAFALAGDVITQTGTDADLSGMTGLAGVTVTSVGAGNAAIKIYNIGTHRLVIDGTLSHNPDIELLISDHYHVSSTYGVITINGVYNYGKSYVGNGVTEYANQTGIVLTSPIPEVFRFSGVFVAPTGVFNWSGGIIKAPRCFVFRNGATVTVNDGVFFNTHINKTMQVRIESTSAASDAKININGLTLDGSDASPVIFSISGWANMVVNFKLGGFQDYVFAGPDQLLLNADVEKNRIERPMLFVSSVETNVARVTWLNPSRAILATSFEGATNRWGWCESKRAVDLTYRDAAGLPAGDVRYWTQDHDSGNRRTVNSISLPTQTYTGLAIGGSGSMGEVWANVQTMHPGEVLALSDDRWATPGVMPLRNCGYLYDINSTDIPLFGVGTLTAEISMLTDVLITESSKAVVDAYTEVDTSAKAYDRAKAHLMDVYQGEMTTIVSRFGDVLDAKTHDLVIDPLAVDVFAFDGATITLKAGVFTGNIVTTGLVTLANGAVVNGGVIDANGARVRVTVNGGATFSIAGHNLTTDTPLAYAAGVTSYEFVAQPGETIRLAAWTEGHDTRVITSTIASASPIEMDLFPNAAIDTGLDVTALLALIGTELGPDGITLRLGAMSINLEQTKAVVHRLLARENALRAMIAAGTGAVVSINTGNVTINVPGFFLRRALGLALADRVEINAFIDTAPALVLDPTFVLNPSEPDGLYVTYLAVATEIDPSFLAREVWAAGSRTLTDASGLGLATSVEVAAVPADVWTVAVRELTATAGLTAEQEAALLAARDHARAANRQTQA